jgi:hypothetical protein
MPEGEQTMKRTHLVAVVVLSLIALVFAYSQSPLQRAQTRKTATTTRQFTLERQVGTQQRINRYFHGDVVSKLKNCWGKVQGKGRIALKYTYTKAGGRWVFSRLETDRSTLPSGQDTVAKGCMSRAVRGTSFPVDAAESTEKTFVITWNWPVPFPTNAAQLTSAMFAAKPTGGGGGGCDGYGTPAKCFACSDSAPLKCNTVCVGYKSCAVTIHNGSASCGSEAACASGGPFGVGGGSVIY